MSCTISGKLGYLDSAGAFQALGDEKVYLVPSRTDFLWTPDAGTNWYPWQKNEELPTAYQYGVELTTNGSGAFSAVVPWSDSEVKLPVSAPLPALYWNVIDPTTGKVYYGPTLEAVVSTAKTIKELTQIASPNDWKIAGSAWTATPVGEGYKGKVTFTDASAEAAVVFPGAAVSSEYTVVCGVGTDSSTEKTVYSIGVKEGSITTTGFTLKLSQTPPTAKTVTAWYRVETP